MTRLPSDSFLPSGALDNDLHLASLAGISSDSSSSVISPLSLPRGATQYFDPQFTSHPSNFNTHSTAALPYQQSKAGSLSMSNPVHNVYSPHAAALRAPPQSQSAHFLSPHLAPTSTQIQYQLQQQRRQQRSVSLSPTRRAATRGAVPMGRTRSAITSPSRMPSSSIMLPLDEETLNGADRIGRLPFNPPPTSMSNRPRTVSADAGNTSSQTAVVQQLKQQNKIIREAWENERKHLEANRSRAEEVYREERAIFEAERAEWDSERLALLERIQRLEENTAKSGSLRSSRRPGRIEEEDIAFSVDGLRGGGSDFSPESIRGSNSSQANTQQHWNVDATYAASFQAHVSPPSTLAAHGMTRLPHPESAPFISQPQQAQEDFMPSDTMDGGENESTPVPIMDVQQIHPDLEGIPIKAKAIKKPTFTDCASSSNGSKSSSGKPSPPIEPVRPRLATKESSKEQTLQVLNAHEDRRLTMHAGHTPSHSLSLFPSAQVTGATNTASSSGEATPVIQVGGDGPTSLPTAAAAESSDTAGRHTSVLVEPPAAAVIPFPEPVLEPEDDVELKGPLMVRNIPAKDEIFFRRLSEKLDEVARSDEAPTVLKSPSPVMQAVAAPLEQKPNGPPQTGTDGTADKADQASSGNSPLGEDNEPEIPLKLKHSNNFGAPFGAIGTFAY